MKMMDLMWIALTMVVAVFLFLLKYQVQDLEDSLTARRDAIENHKRAIRVLNAEWTYLNDPVRLERLAQEHLKLVELGPDLFISIDDLPWRADVATEGTQ